jgi:hypothetical protein
MQYDISEQDLLSIYDPRLQQEGFGEYYRANLPRQRGSGFGSFFKSIGRFLLPLVRRHVLPHALSTAKNVMGDVLEGKNVGESLKEHGLEGIKEVGRSLLDSQSGSGLKRKRSTPLALPNKRSRKSKGAKKKGIPSIFDAPWNH